MAGKRVKFKNKGLEEIISHPAVRADIKRRADNVAAEAARAQAVNHVAEGAGDRQYGYLVTDLTEERNRAASSVMAIGKGGYTRERQFALLQALKAGKN